MSTTHATPNRRPRLIVAVFIAALVAALIVVAVIRIQGPAHSTSPRYALARFAPAAVLCLAYPWWRLPSLRSTFRRDVAIAIAMPVVLALALGALALVRATGTFLGWGALAWFTLSMISVGVIEEVLARGFDLGVIARQSRPDAIPWMAVIASSVIFGLSHLVNIPRTGVAATLIQVVYASLVGLYFCALRIRTASLLPGILTHAALDFAFYVAVDCFSHSGRAGGTAIIAGLAPVVLGIGVAIWSIPLLRGARRARQRREAAA